MPLRRVLLQHVAAARQEASLARREQRERCEPLARGKADGAEYYHESTGNYTTMIQEEIHTVYDKAAPCDSLVGILLFLCVKCKHCAVPEDLE